MINPNLSADDTSCGVGRERRMVDCVRSDGKIVHPFHCRVEGRRVPTLLRVCNVPCPRNCEISEWEMWSPCPEKCGAPTVQRRIRYILAKAENGGQSCRQSDSLEGIIMLPDFLISHCRFGQQFDCAQL